MLYTTKQRRQILEAMAGEYGIKEVDGVPIAKVGVSTLRRALLSAVWEQKDQPGMSRGEMSAVREACSRRYQIPDEELKAVPDVLLRMLQGRNTTHRHRVMAARTLLTLRQFTLQQAVTMANAEQDGDGDGPRRISTPLAGPGEVTPQDTVQATLVVIV